MSGFVVRVWCRDCENDPMGCFDGEDTLIHEDQPPFEPKVFAAREEAEDAGYRFTGGPPWDFRVEEKADDAAFSKRSESGQ